MLPVESLDPVLGVVSLRPGPNPACAVGGGVSVFSSLHADHAPRRRADDAVHGQAVACLQAAHGGLGFRAEFAVDGQVQRLLQPRDGVGAVQECRGRRAGAPVVSTASTVAGSAAAVWRRRLSRAG